MKKIYLTLIILFSFLSFAKAQTAQQSVPGYNVTTSGYPKFVPVSPTTPFPITVSASNFLCPSCTGGELLIGNASGAFSINKLTQGSGITIGNGNGTITISTNGGGGTVTSISCVTANGVSCTVANPTTTPALTFTLGAITPTSVDGLIISTTTGTLAIANGKTLTQNNTLTYTGTDGSSVNFGTGGTVLYGNQTITLTGDTTGSGTTAITTTTSKVNGVSYGTSPSTNTVPVVTGANAITYETVPNAALANSSITVSGQSCTLGSSCTIPVTGLTNIAANTVVGNNTGSPAAPAAQTSIALSGGISGGSLTSTGNVLAGSGNSVGWTSSTLMQAPANGSWKVGNFAGTNSFTLSSPAATATPIIQLGALDAAAPVAQILGVQNVVAGTTNTAGANFTITGSQGTGTGVGGNIIFRVAPAGTTGTAQNALATALTITNTKEADFASTVTSVGGYGNNGGTPASQGLQFSGSTTNVVSSGAGSVINLLNSTGVGYLKLTPGVSQLGGADAAAPTVQTLNVQNVVTGTSNTAGANFTIAGSQSTGTGIGGSIIFQTSAAGTTGTAQNALTTALTIDSTQKATFAGMINVPDGTCGTPAFGFTSEPGTGFYRNGASTIETCNNGSPRWYMASTIFGSVSAAGGVIRAGNVTATFPTFSPNVADAKSGIGSDAAGDVSIITDNATVATENTRFTSTGVIIESGGLTVSGGTITTNVTGSTQCLQVNSSGVISGTSAACSTSSGTVTAVSIATANGFSGSSSGGATPALTIVAGAITPTSINGLTITTTTGTLTITSAKTLAVSNSLTFTGTDGSSVAFGTGGTLAYTANNLSVFAATTSAQLAGVISDETGTGLLVFGTAPTFTTSITDPLYIGGTAASSTLTLESTSGVGTTDSIIFKTGSQVTAATIASSGLITTVGGVTIGGTLTTNITGSTQCLQVSTSGVVSGTGSTCGGGSGSVTSVSVVTANGVSGSVATATTTPAITLTLGAITPSSVAATGTISGTTLTSSIATGTAPLTVTSTTNVANLNASTLTGNAVGTSGGTIPLNNGNITHSGTILFTGTVPTLANGNAAVAASATAGGIYIGQGSTSDITFENKTGASVCAVATGTTTLNCTGLQVGGVAVLTANQSITLTGAVTGSGTTAITTTLATQAANTILANNTGSTASPTAVNAATVGASDILILRQIIGGAVSTVQFTGLSGNYDYCRTTWSNVVPNTSTAALDIQVGEGGTPTYGTTGYNWLGTLTTIAGGNSAYSATNNVGWEVGRSLGTTAGKGASGTAIIHQPFAVVSHHINYQYYSTDDAGNDNGVNANGTYTTDQNVLTAIQYKISTGTMTAGTFELECYRNQ